MLKPFEINTKVISLLKLPKRGQITSHPRFSSKQIFNYIPRYRGQVNYFRTVSTTNV
ncbi:MAG: hypothetical protein ACTS6G_00300 [Candidatus Hodgkinia cicadicola]